MDQVFEFLLIGIVLLLFWILKELSRLKDAANRIDKKL